MSTRQATSPRIYVACLAAYNAGRLHGRWIDLAGLDASDLHEEIQGLLTESPEPHAEEWAVHDYEGFGTYSVHEYEPLENLTRLAELIAEHGEIITAWLEHTGYALDDEAGERFSEAYRGSWRSLEEYAEDLLTDIGALEGLPENLRCYFDYERFARDLELGGDVWVHVATDGEHHVFDAL